MLENHFYPTKIIELFPKECIEKWMKHEKELVYRKGELITAQGKPTNEVYLIKKGNARIFHIHEDGKECILDLLTEGEFINLIDIFTENESNAFSKALTEVTVVAVPREKVKEIVEQTPALAMSLLSYLSQRLIEVIEILEQVAYGKVEERLIFLFKKFADPHKEDEGWYPIPISVTHQDLAGMVASTRETITLLINKLTQRGVIRQHQNKIWVRVEEL